MAFALEGTTRILQTAFDRSNFAIEMHQAFLDLVITGTGVIMVEEAPLAAQRRHRSTPPPPQDGSPIPCRHRLPPGRHHHQRLSRRGAAQCRG
jgi:hypothetical protein